MFLQKKFFFYFLRGDLDAAFPLGESWVHARCAPRQQLVK